MTDVMEQPDYEIVDRALRQAAAGVSAAESHGLLCGMLCVARESQPGAWLEQVLEDHDPASGADPDCATVLRGVYHWTVMGLAAEDFDFDLLLPDEARSLSVRADALAAWAQGFLAGLGQAIASSAAPLPGEVREVLADMAEISKASAAGEVDAEGGERAIAEIVEYLRVAVLLVQEAIRPEDSGAGQIH